MAVVKLAALVLTAIVWVATLGIGVSYWLFVHGISSDLDSLTATARTPGVTVTEAMLAGLPVPAQRYFRFAGVIGQPIPRIVRITQKGRILFDTYKRVGGGAGDFNALKFMKVAAT